jgi:hypothetical protein
MSNLGSGNNSPNGCFNLIAHIFHGNNESKFNWLSIIVCSLLFILIVWSASVFNPLESKFVLKISKIEGTAGSLAIESKGKENVALMVSAAGSRGENLDPWVRTGVNVAVKDTIKIEASGSVHTAMKKLIEVSTTDTNDSKQSWVGPKGSTLPPNDWDDKRRSLRLVPNEPYGALVVAILNDEKVVKDARSIEQFEVKTKGELILAVNDIKLQSTSRDLYALPVEKNEGYYDKKLISAEKLKLSEEKAENAEGVVRSWTKDEKNRKAQALYQKYLKTWEKIEQNSNYTIWFDDNIGEFFVSITKLQA